MKTDTYRGFSKIIDIKPATHCGVSGCCEGGPMDGDRPYGPHGVRDEMRIYILRKGDRAVSLTVGTGKYLPSVTWIAPEDSKPMSWDLWWHEANSSYETPCPFLGGKTGNCDGTSLGARELYTKLLREWRGDVPDDAIFNALIKEYELYWASDLWR